MKEKMCIYAGIFIAAMFLLTIVPVNATIVPEIQMMEQEVQLMEQQQMEQRQYVQGDQYGFPAQLPPGISSLSCITKRRAAIIDPWNGELLVYDVGFSFWSMRLRDGPAHSLNFAGTITVVWHKNDVAQNINYPLPENWINWVLGGFDIYRGGTYIFSQPFYTATIHGVIYKDMGDPEYKTRDLFGYNYLIENGLFPHVLLLGTE